MERINKNPVIIEFNGLPGSGKTTIAQELQRHLIKTGKSCLNYYCRSSLFKSPRFLYLMPHYWREIEKAKKNSLSLSLNEENSYYLHFLQYIRMYREYIKDVPSDILIIDQGILQSFLSMSHQNKIQSTGIVELFIKSFKIDVFPLVLINCDVDENVANKRIEDRKENGCRVESMSLSERQKTLITQSANLTIIRKAISNVCLSLPSIEIDATNSIDNNVDQIVSFINKKIYEI